MGMNGDQYRNQLASLLPKGLAWSREGGSGLMALLRGLAEEFSRIDGRGDDLLREVVPTTSIELLSDWERVAGLPDECITSSQTIQERRNALLGRLAGTGGQSAAFFIEVAKNLGYTVTITEFKPFRAGISRAGDALTNGDWVYAFRVNAPATTVSEFRAGIGSVGEPLRTWGNDLLECVLRRIRPAHTIIIFGYV
jgi:uncharacterized protein YmfQ (DUF2313 family)